MSIRVGVVGTSYWATRVHAPAVATASRVMLAGIWGRDLAKARAAAEQLGCPGTDDLDALLGSCDAITIAVPPEAQGPIALRAIDAGKHLLLEKPVTLEAASSAQIAARASRARLSTLVFFTHRFMPQQARWVHECQEHPWQAASVEWTFDIDAPGSRFAPGNWRGEVGGLWDLGPHALSLLVPILGDVVDVADASVDRRGTVRCQVEHQSGAWSQLVLGVQEPRAMMRVSVGDQVGWSTMPKVTTERVVAMGIAIDTWVDLINSGTVEHGLDAGFGARIDAMLADIAQCVV